MHLSLKIILAVIAGGIIGAVTGYFGKCASGACPLTSSPLSGALFGAIIGFLVTFGK
ncbi:MAG: DUF6132 family protein [Candidatus Omnitrophota bacterium]